MNENIKEDFFFGIFFIHKIEQKQGMLEDNIW